LREDEALPLGVLLWRPFLGEAFLPPLFIHVLPLPWAGAPWVLVFDEAMASRFPPENSRNGAGMADASLSPVILTSAARSVYDLLANPHRGDFDYPRLDQALVKGPWKRRGIYLFRAQGRDAVDSGYTALFKTFLDAGFLLPPDPGEPLVLSGLMPPGEEAKLAALLSIE
jgi:hypothetical protein